MSDLSCITAAFTRPSTKCRIIGVTLLNSVHFTRFYPPSLQKSSKSFSDARPTIIFLLTVLQSSCLHPSLHHLSARDIRRNSRQAQLTPFFLTFVNLAYNANDCVFSTKVKIIYLNAKKNLIIKVIPPPHDKILKTYRITSHFKS